MSKYASAVPKNWEWELIFGRAVKAISSSSVRSPCKGGIEGDKLLWEPTYCKLERLLLLP